MLWLEDNGGERKFLGGCCSVYVSLFISRVQRTLLPVQPVLQQLDILGSVLFQPALCVERKAQREQKPVTCTSLITFISNNEVS